MSDDRRFTQDVLDGLTFVAGADLSPDGGRVVYGRFTTDGDKDSTSLWLLEVDGGAERRLTAGEGRDSAPAFSPDGSRIAFLSDRGGVAQVHVIAVDGGEAVAVTALERGVSGPPAWSPDGSTLAFAAGPQGEARDPAAPYRVTRAIYRFDAMGYIDDVKQDLYLVPAAGGEARRLTDDARSNHSPIWAPDGRSVVYFTMFDPDDWFPFPRLGRVELDGSVSEVEQPRGLVTAAGFAPDGRLAFVVDMHSGRPVGSQAQLYVADDGGVECRTGSLFGHVNRGVGGDAPSLTPPSPRLLFRGDAAVVPVQIGGCARLHAVALSGPEAFVPLTRGDHGCAALAVAGDRVLFAASEINRPAELCLLDGGEERRLTDVSGEGLAGVEMPEVERVEATAADGARVEGWFLKPAGGSAPYPTVLHIHGGPHAAYGHAFHSEMQLLAGAGYGVLFLNHRGSTGYGDDFANGIVGDWGNLDYGDLMAGVDRAVAMGLADPDRLGVTGLSGGGNLSCWIVGHTDRFKAAVPENPVSSHLSEFGVADLGIWFLREVVGGAPAAMPEAYLKMSPIMYAHRCTTPTLLIQGENDMRCPPEQSEQFYAALTLAGCTVEMLRLPGMPHGGSIMGPPPIRRAQNAALIEWMDRWVTG